MSRTRKGSKGPGWEPWSNLHERQKQKADYVEEPLPPWEDDICQGCPLCMCVKCGGIIAANLTEKLRCLVCGYEPFSDE